MAELSTGALTILAAVYVHQADYSELHGEHARFGGLSAWMLAPIIGLSWEDAIIALHELDGAGLAASAVGDRYALTDGGMAYARSPVGIDAANRVADQIRASAPPQATKPGASSAVPAPASRSGSRMFGALGVFGRRGRPQRAKPKHR